MVAYCWDFLLHIPWMCLPYQVLIININKFLSVGASSLRKKINNKKVLNSLTHPMLASFCVEFLLKKI